MRIDQLVERAYGNSLAKGFHDGPKNIPEKLCLIHSEISEALECDREGQPVLWYREMKPEGLASELADVVIRVADLCGALKIDLQQVIKEKMAYNETRSHKHGKKY